MHWELVLILVIAIPVILFPAAYVWYINIGGLVALFNQAREKRAIRKSKRNLNRDDEQELEYEEVLTETLKKYPW